MYSFLLFFFSLTEHCISNAVEFWKTFYSGGFHDNRFLQDIKVFSYSGQRLLRVPWEVKSVANRNSLRSCPHTVQVGGLLKKNIAVNNFHIQMFVMGSEANKLRSVFKQKSGAAFVDLVEEMSTIFFLKYNGENSFFSLHPEEDQYFESDYPHAAWMSQEVIKTLDQQITANVHFEEREEVYEALGHIGVNADSLDRANLKFKKNNVETVGINLRLTFIPTDPTECNLLARPLCHNLALYILSFNLIAFFKNPRLELNRLINSILVLKGAAFIFIVAVIEDYEENNEHVTFDSILESFGVSLSWINHQIEFFISRKLPQVSFSSCTTEEPKINENSKRIMTNSKGCLHTFRIWVKGPHETQALFALFLQTIKNNQLSLTKEEPLKYFMAFYDSKKDKENFLQVAAKKLQFYEKAEITKSNLRLKDLISLFTKNGDFIYCGEEIRSFNLHSNLYRNLRDCCDGHKGDLKMFMETAEFKKKWLGNVNMHSPSFLFYVQKEIVLLPFLDTESILTIHTTKDFGETYIRNELFNQVPEELKCCVGTAWIEVDSCFSFFYFTCLKSFMIEDGLRSEFVSKRFFFTQGGTFLYYDSSEGKIFGGSTNKERFFDVCKKISSACSNVSEKLNQILDIVIEAKIKFQIVNTDTNTEKIIVWSDLKPEVYRKIHKRPNRVFHFFLSHCCGSGIFNTHKRIYFISDFLKLNGIYCWTDTEHLSGNVEESMYRGVEDSRLFIAFLDIEYLTKLSPDGKEAPNVQKEFYRALNSPRVGKENIVYVNLVSTKAFFQKYSESLKNILDVLMIDFSSPSLQMQGMNKLISLLKP